MFMRERFKSPIDNLLCICLRLFSIDAKKDSVRESYKQVNESTLFDLSKRLKIDTVISYTLMSIFGSDLPAVWAESCKHAFQKTTELLNDLEALSNFLSRNDVDIVILENGAIARSIFPKAELFNFGDLDILIRPAHLHFARIALQEIGYDVRVNSLGLPEFADGRYEFVKRSGDKKIYLQHSMIARRWVQNYLEPDIDLLFQNSVSIPNSKIKILNPKFFLFQLCAHCASHGYVRSPGVKLYLDIDWFVRLSTINWADFVGLIVKYRYSTRAYLALVISKVILETPIPETVLEVLRPPIWKEKLLTGMIQRAGLFNPDDHKFNKIEFVLFTSLLHDDLSGLTRSVFPDANWMRAHYDFIGYLLLPYYYIRRLIDLAFRRSI